MNGNFNISIIKNKFYDQSALTVPKALIITSSKKIKIIIKDGGFIYISDGNKNITFEDSIINTTSAVNVKEA